MSHFPLKRRPTVVLAERWDGPGEYCIPPSRTLHGGVLFVQPGDYIVKRTYDDWYPLGAQIAEADYEIVRGVPTDEVAEAMR